MSDIVERLRGVYRIPITDGLGAVGAGEEPDNPKEFVRKFGSPPIQREAADEIERLRKALRPFVELGQVMFVDPENGWSDADVLSIEADPDFGVFAHLKAGDFRAAYEACETQKIDGNRVTMWAEIVEDEDGTRWWRCNEEGSKGGDTEHDFLSLSAAAFPVGTRLEISEPVRP